MKKKIFIFIAAIALSASFAKADGLWNRSNFRTEGFTFSTSLGAPQVADYTFGWQFGPHWNLGIDLDAFFIYSDINARFYISDDRITPFLQAKVGLAPTLQVGMALGKFELAIGATHYLVDAITDYDFPWLFPAFSVGYTFSFGKW